MNDRKENKLQNEKISKLVLSYSLTTLIALTLNSIYTLSDSLFVSWGVGDNAMGGITLVFPFVLVQSAISTALGGGAASIVSRKIGNGDFEGASRTVFNARVTFYITAGIVTVVGFLFREQILNALGVTDVLYQSAKEYYTIILLGNIFSTGFSAIIRAEGKMLYAMLIWVIPISIDIIMDAIFIFVLGLGVKGTAYSTVICQFFSFSMSILFFAKFSILRYKRQKLHTKTIKEILLIGLPSLVQTGALSLSLLVMNNILKSSAGTLAINTFAYINKLIMLAMIPFLALSQAISPIVGYNYGTKNQMRVKRSITFTLFLTVGYALFALILLETIPNYLFMMFTKDAEIISFGARAIRIVAISLPFMPFAMILGAAYQAQGKRKQALLLYSVSLIFLVICALFMLKINAETGAWWAYVAGNALAAVTAITIYWVDNKRKNKISS